MLIAGREDHTIRRKTKNVEKESYCLLPDALIRQSFSASFFFGLPFFGFMKQKQEQQKHRNKNFIALLLPDPQAILLFRNQHLEKLSFIQSLYLLFTHISLDPISITFTLEDAYPYW